MSEEYALPRLKYYMFDWDDNILHMPTPILMEHWTGTAWEPVSLGTAEFARVRRDTERYRPPNDDWDQAFIEFYDNGQRGDQAFIEDTRTALAPIISGHIQGAPSFYRFKKALIEGSLFAIITARAHSSASIRKGVEYFIDHVFLPEERCAMIRNPRGFIKLFGEDGTTWTDEEVFSRYLDMNRYRGVTSPEFQELMDFRLEGAESPERAKQLAVKEFVNHVLGMIRDNKLEASISVGFSDDDPHNVQAILGLLQDDLARSFPEVKFVVYDTSDPEGDGQKIIVRGV